MNYLVFPGNILHLTPNIIRGQVQTINRLLPGTLEQNFFCVIMYYQKMLYDNVDINPYDKIFSELGISKYKLFYSSKELIQFLVTRDRNSQIIYHKKLMEKEQVLINCILGLIKPRLLSHCSLVCWGAGDFTLQKSDGIKRWLSNCVLRYSFNRYKCIFTLSTEDYSLLMKAFPKCNGSYTPYLRRSPIILSGHKKNDLPLVMVSHSGWSHNNHFESFKVLSNFAGHIRVLCPLCYGEEDYICSVIDEGKRIFGEHFKYFRELLEFNEYKNVLSNVDVFVSSAMCQTGLGAIILCISNGSKIFVQGNNYGSMLQSGFQVGKVQDIVEMSLNEFCEPLSTLEAQHNVDVINRESYYGSSVIDNWVRMYTY